MEKAAVVAEGLSLKGERGWVYQDVDLRVAADGVTALHGEAGSGRTALLLTLGGRMRFTGGSLTVFGHRLTGGMREMRAVQRLAALGTVTGVNELESSLTVAEQVGEALDLYLGLLGPFRPKLRRQRIDAVLRQAGLEVDPGTPVWDLQPDERQLLGAACALVGEPKLLLLDDVGAGLTADRQRALWSRLLDIADSGVTVLATCHDPEPAQGPAQVVQLPGKALTLPRKALTR